MRQQISFLTQSRFYSPAFNAAIFDGPIRLYFAQYQESLALKLYFVIQEKAKAASGDRREAFRRTGMNIFVMIYPSAESFMMSFDETSSQDKVVVERLGHDFVVGVRGPVGDTDIDMIYERIDEITRAFDDVMARGPFQRVGNEAGA